MTITVIGSKSKSWCTDKSVQVYVDGIKQDYFYWGVGLRKVFKDTKKRLGIKRAKSFFIYKDNQLKEIKNG